MEIKVKEVIKKKQLTIRRAAKICGVPKSTLADICAGATPNLDTLEQIAKGLDVRMTDLFDSPYK